MIAYKGFNPDLTCTMGRGRFQYRENEWIEEDKANCVKNGFHAAENPMDCLNYYGDWDRSVYYEVEAEGDIDEDGADSKLSCTRMRLVRKLDLHDFVAAVVEYTINHPERKQETKRYGKIRFMEEKGEAEQNGAVIVKGEHPMAAGPVGSIIALIHMNGDGIVDKACIKRIDGEKYKGNTWYRI